MTTIKDILFRVLLVALLLVAFNFIYKAFFFEDDLQEHSGLINLVRTVVNDNCEIVYVGESSNNTARSDDADKRMISDFVADYFPTVKMGNITKPASHAGIYYELLRNIPEVSPVKTVVVTLNLRSFNAQWIYSDLETPLQKSIVLLKDRPALYNRFMLSFKGYDIKTNEEREKQFKHMWRHSPLLLRDDFPYENVAKWDKGTAEKGIRNDDGSINYELTTLACHYIKGYGFSIDFSSNPRVTDFDNIVRLAEERNWNLVFNLMAENIQKADSLVGDDLVFLMRRNRDKLIERYQKNGVLVVDNLEAVEDEQFIDQNWTTEHYAEKGRRIIAANVAKALKGWYPTQFVDVAFIPDTISTKP
ncbi:MAG: DUF4843 domain-containing protein [Bacteroidales bacterium]|nr:DUF4843 domain-containing protein [Bacteroidales bacterium]